MNPPGPGDETNGAIVYRVGQLEAMQRDMRVHLDRRLDVIAQRMDDLAFVRGDVYASERGSFEKEQKMQDERIDSALRLAMWCLGILVTSILAAVFGIVTTVVA